MIYSNFDTPKLTSGFDMAFAFGEIQKRILRTMFRLGPTDTCRDAFKNFRILTLTSLFIFELCVYIFLNKTLFICLANLHNLIQDISSNSTYPIAE